MIEIIRTEHCIIPATHLQKTGISVLPYVFIVKGSDKSIAKARNTLAPRQAAHRTRQSRHAVL